MKNFSIKTSNSPIALIIFGVTGDLAKRKLLPAIYQMLLEKQIDNPIHIIGFARRPWDSQIMKDTLIGGIQKYARVKPIEVEVVDVLFDKAHYVQSAFEDEEGYSNLNEYIEENGYKKVLYYLATPPSAYKTIIENLSDCRYSSTKKE